MGMKEQPFDPRDHEAFVREIDPKVYDSAVTNLPRGVVPRRRGMTWRENLAEEIAWLDGCNTRGGAALVLFGHSYMDQNTTIATMLRSQIDMAGEMTWVNFLLDMPFDLVAEEGVGGERIADALTRISRIAAFRPTVIVCSIGTNDLKNTYNLTPRDFDGYVYPADATQTDLQVCCARMDTLLDELIATRAQMVLVFGESAPANGASGQNKQLTARTKRFNDHLKFRCRDRGGPLVYVPVELAMTDPVSVAGDMKTLAYTDSIHPSYIGAYNRAQIIIKQIGAKIREDYGFDRLIDWAGDTYTNLKVAGTSFTCNGTTMTIPLSNGTTDDPLFRTGDVVVINNADATYWAWGGKYRVTAHSATSITLACTKAAASWTGTVNVSSASNMFDNPLFLTQTGGSKTGTGGTLTGNLPANVEVTFSTGATCTVTYPEHTDRDGNATGFGYWFQLEFSLPADAEAYVIFYAHRRLTGNAYDGRFWPGDVIGCSCDYQLISPVGLFRDQFGLRISCTDATGAVLSSGSHTTQTRKSGNTDPHPNKAVRGVLRPPDWQSPVGGPSELTRIDGRMHFGAGASGATFTVRFGRVSVYRVDEFMRDMAVNLMLR